VVRFVDAGVGFYCFYCGSLMFVL